MSIQNSSSTYGLNESLSLSDQQLFSIYLRYPDGIDGDKHHEDRIVLPPKPQQGSGPGSSIMLVDHAELNGLPSNSDQNLWALDVPDFDGEWHELASLIQASKLAASMFALLHLTRGKYS
ncbi:hypothetical protein MRB53_039189 [Persea americana]|nr:hypothetical protein MRB53_039189 [Persea americana]